MIELFKHYEPTSLEGTILSFYRKHSISSPQDIDLDWIAHDTNVWVYYKSSPSTSYNIKGMWSIVVDDRLSPAQQRVEFAHELGHVFLHAGHQIAMNADFRAMQEWQADRFAMYLLCPTPMIVNRLPEADNRGRMVDELASAFSVPDYFIDARLHLLEQRLQQLHAQREVAATIDSMPQYGRDYDQVVRHPINPRIEYYLQNGQVMYQRKRAEV